MNEHALRKRSLWIPTLAWMLTACKPEPARTPAPVEPDRIVTLEGTINLHNGEQLAYRAIIAPKPGTRGEYVGTIDIPKQALAGASLEQIVYQPRRRIKFELAFPGTPRWTGDVGADGAVTCAFTQGDIRLACTMRDVSPRPALARD